MVMRYWQTLLSLALLSLLFTPLLGWSDALTASVDRQQLSVGESLVLTVQYDGKADVDTPDFSALEQDFHILGRQQNSRRQISNSQLSQQKTWQFNLQPRRNGSLIIPSFTANSMISDAIEITVSDQPSSSTGNARKETLYGEADVDILEPYVQQQVILTWRLVAKLTVNAVQMPPPDFGDTLSMDLGNQRYQRTNSNGETEIVIEQRYALFPQRSGTLNIQPHHFQIELILNTGNRGFFSNTRTVNVQTPGLQLQVKPGLASQQPWLPTQKLQLHDQLSATTVAQGQPFTRQLSISALGVLAEQLPNLTTESPNVKRYAEPVTRNNNQHDDSVLSQANFNETLIAEKTGTLVLPEINIQWYDTLNQRWQQAQLPQRELQVVPAADHATASPPASTPSNDAKDDQAENVDQAETGTIEHRKHEAEAISTGNPMLLWGLVTALLVSWLGFAVYVLRQRRSCRHSATPAAQTKQTVSNNVINAAIAQSDAAALYRELLRHQRQTANSTQMQTVLNSLSAHLYHAAASDWPLWKQATEFTNTTEKTAAKGDTLAELYR